MLVSKIGDELAVRLSADDAARLGLKEGDQVEVTRMETRTAEQAARRKEEAFERLLKFQGKMPADFKFDRDEANER